MAEVEKMTLSVSFEEKWEFLATFWIKNREKLQPSAREALDASHRSASKKCDFLFSFLRTKEVALCDKMESRIKSTENSLRRAEAERPMDKACQKQCTLLRQTLSTA